MYNSYKSLFSLIRLPKPFYFGDSFKLECVITANDKFSPGILMEQAPTDDDRSLSTEAKSARGGRKRSLLLENTSHADNAFGRESSVTFSHRGHLFKDLHKISSAEGSPKRVFH